MSNSKGLKTLESMSQADWYNKWTMEKFEKYLTGEMLEVGCGIGNFTPSLTKFGPTWAIDIDPKVIEKTKKDVNGKAKVGFGDIEKGEYFFDKEKFDSIICLNVLEHIQNDDQALENLYKLLKKEGILVLLIPSHNFLYGEIDRAIGHFRRYEQNEILDKLKSVGFKILESQKLNFLGAIGWFISGKILRQKQVEEKNVKIFNLIAPLFLKLESLIKSPIGTSILVIAKKV